MKILSSLGNHAGGAWFVLWLIHGWSIFCTVFLCVEVFCILFVAIDAGLEAYNAT